MAGCVMGRPQTGSLPMPYVSGSLAEKPTPTPTSMILLMASDSLQAEEGRGQESLPPLTQNAYTASNTELLRHAVIIETLWQQGN